MNIKITKFIPSPNYNNGRGGYKPDAIVIHIMAGVISSADEWFSNPKSKVSAHYGISLEGETHQYVYELNTAWHAGNINNPTWKGLKRNAKGKFVNPNLYTIGIEHEGSGNTDWTETMYQSSAKLIADISQRYSIPLDREHIIGHHEIYSLKSCPGIVDLDKLIRYAKLQLSK